MVLGVLREAVLPARDGGGDVRAVGGGGVVRADLLLQEARAVHFREYHQRCQGLV